MPLTHSPIHSVIHLFTWVFRFFFVLFFRFYNLNIQREKFCKEMMGQLRTNFHFVFGNYQFSYMIDRFDRPGSEFVHYYIGNQSELKINLALSYISQDYNLVSHTTYVAYINFYTWVAGDLQCNVPEISAIKFFFHISYSWKVWPEVWT